MPHFGLMDEYALGPVATRRPFYVLIALRCNHSISKCILI